MRREIASTGAAYYTYFTLTCTKLLPADQSNLRATWKIPGAGNYSYVCGGFISIGGVTSFENRYFYTPYSEPDGHMWGTDVFEGIGSGTAIPVSIGFNVHHGEGGNYPYTYINPIQGRNDARRRGPASSNILIFEVAI